MSEVKRTTSIAISDADRKKLMLITGEYKLNTGIYKLIDTHYKFLQSPVTRVIANHYGMEHRDLHEVFGLLVKTLDENWGTFTDHVLPKLIEREIKPSEREAMEQAIVNIKL